MRVEDILHDDREWTVVTPQFALRIWNARLWRRDTDVNGHHVSHCNDNGDLAKIWLDEAALSESEEAERMREVHRY
jgi:hypothetical protein